MTLRTTVALAAVTALVVCSPAHASIGLNINAYSEPCAAPGPIIGPISQAYQSPYYVLGCFEINRSYTFDINGLLISENLNPTIFAPLNLGGPFATGIDNRSGYSFKYTSALNLFPDGPLWNAAGSLFQYLYQSQASSIGTSSHIDPGGVRGSLPAVPGLQIFADDPGIAAALVTIPAGAKYAVFPFQIVTPGDGGELAVYFDDQLLWNSPLSALPDQGSGVFDVSEIAGKTGLLTYELVSADTTTISAVVPLELFLSDQPAVAAAPEPASIGVLGLGVIGMLALRKRVLADPASR